MTEKKSAYQQMKNAAAIGWAQATLTTGFGAAFYGALHHQGAFVAGALSGITCFFGQEAYKSMQKWRDTSVEHVTTVNKNLESVLSDEDLLLVRQGSTALIRVTDQHITLGRGANSPNKFFRPSQVQFYASGEVPKSKGLSWSEKRKLKRVAKLHDLKATQYSSSVPYSIGRAIEAGTAEEFEALARDLRNTLAVFQFERK